MKKNIPAAWLAGMFFFSACASAAPLDLATDLFEQHEWTLCRRECRRALMEQAEPTERFQLLDGICAVRLQVPPEEALPLFHPIIEADADPQVTAIASYQAGRLQWQLDQPEKAVEGFSLAFHTTTNKALFLRASCALYQLFESHPDLKQNRDGLVSQINTSRDQWYGALFAETAKPDPARDTPPAPNWLVRFYRAQISPAIGNRCTLEPSCSEYFHQAYCRHGLKAVPMIGDRFFREPEVSNEKKNPVVMPNGLIRYRDPLSDHDFWMKK